MGLVETAKIYWASVERDCERQGSYTVVERDKRQA